MFPHFTLSSHLTMEILAVRLHVAQQRIFPALKEPSLKSLDESRKLKKKKRRRTILRSMTVSLPSGEEGDVWHAGCLYNG